MVKIVLDYYTNHTERYLIQKCGKFYVQIRPIFSYRVTQDVITNWWIF